MKRNPIILGIIVTLILTVIYSSAYSLMGLKTFSVNSLPYDLLANAMVAGLMCIVAFRTSLRGLQLGLLVFALLFVIGHFNTLVEAYVFNVTDRPRTLAEIGTGVLASVLFAAVFTALIGTKETVAHVTRMKRSVISWIVRVAAADALYLFLYLLAGGILYFSYPPLGEFYEGKLPPMGQMILLQLLVRGLIFTGTSILLIQYVDLKKIEMGILAGALFAVIGGIAPLLPPSDVMPQHIRMAHGIEVGISNFILGFALVMMLWQSQKALDSGLLAHHGEAENTEVHGGRSLTSGV